MRKAEMGVGTLVIFIALIIVGAIAAGVLIDTQSQLQEKSLTTGQQAKAQISTNAKVIEISGRDARDGRVDNLFMVMKLAPGSEPIKLDSVLYSEATINSSSSLSMRDGECINDVFNGFFTARSEPVDMRTGEYEDPISASFSFSSSQTSELMIGKVAVAVVFVESNGSADDDYENWTVTERELFLNYTNDAFNWWRYVEPRSHLSFTVESYDATTSYEPITRDTTAGNETLWISEVLDQIGATDGTGITERSRIFSDGLRNRMNAHWGFIMFAVDSSDTGCFTDSHAGIAVINGPYTYIASDCWTIYTDVLIAHELGHIFGASDEYRASACACTDTSGYLNIETQNCDAEGCLTNISNIMRDSTEAIEAYGRHQVSIFTRGQLGIVDTDENDIMDPVDMLFGPPSSIDVSQENINGLAGTDYAYEVDESSVIGFFTKEYLNEATDHIEGNLQRGDIIKMCSETSRSVVEDEKVRVNFIPKTGTQTYTEFITPEVLSLERVFLYP